MKRKGWVRDLRLVWWFIVITRRAAPGVMTCNAGASLGGDLSDVVMLVDAIHLSRSRAPRGAALEALDKPPLDTQHVAILAPGMRHHQPELVELDAHRHGFLQCFLQPRESRVNFGIARALGTQTLNLRDKLRKNVVYA